jgi:hypothetical protein
MRSLPSAANGSDYVAVFSDSQGDFEMQGPLYATLKFTRLGQVEPEEHRNVLLEGVIAHGERLKVRLEPPGDTNSVYANVASVDESASRRSAGGRGQDAAGALMVFATEVVPHGDFFVAVDNNSNTEATHGEQGHSYEFRLIPVSPFVAGGTVRENQRADRGSDEFFEDARSAVLSVAREHNLIPTAHH